MLSAKGLHVGCGKVYTVLLGRTLLVFFFIANTARLISSETEAPTVHTVIFHEELFLHVLMQILGNSVVFHIHVVS